MNFNKTYIIAEAGVNHNGDIDIAKKLIDMAKDCGADAVKFQTFKAEEIISVFAEKAKYQKENMPIDESQFDMVKKLELKFEDFKELQSYCKIKDIDFISTPVGKESLDYLIKLDVPLIKIGSTEVTNPEFLKQVGNTKKPIILSTGMSTLGEIEKAVDAIYSTENHNITLMHCITDYPTKIEDVNLRAMLTLKEAFKLPVGFSDHTLSYESAIAAVALGAIVIEKHITLDKDMEGPDHKASMDWKYFKQYVESIRKTEKLLGDGVKKPTENEKLIMIQARRSIVAAIDLEEGDILTADKILFKRPGTGISPELFSILEGRKLKKRVAKDMTIQWSDL